jgi:hypothetical protein
VCDVSRKIPTFYSPPQIQVTDVPKPRLFLSSSASELESLHQEIRWLFVGPKELQLMWLVTNDRALWFIFGLEATVLLFAQLTPLQDDFSHPSTFVDITLNPYQFK